MTHMWRDFESGFKETLARFEQCSELIDSEAQASAILQANEHLNLSKSEGVAWREERNEASAERYLTSKERLLASYDRNNRNQFYHFIAQRENGGACFLTVAHHS